MSSPKAVLATLMCHGMSQWQINEVIFMSPNVRRVAGLIEDLSYEEMSEVISLLEFMDGIDGP